MCKNEQKNAKSCNFFFLKNTQNCAKKIMKMQKISTAGKKIALTASAAFSISAFRSDLILAHPIWNIEKKQNKIDLKS